MSCITIHRHTVDYIKIMLYAAILTGQSTLNLKLLRSCKPALHHDSATGCIHASGNNSFLYQNRCYNEGEYNYAVSFQLSLSAITVVTKQLVIDIHPCKYFTYDAVICLY